MLAGLTEEQSGNDLGLELSSLHESLQAWLCSGKGASDVEMRPQSLALSMGVDIALR
jgi:hypothetical protein